MVGDIYQRTIFAGYSLLNKLRARKNDLPHGNRFSEVNGPAEDDQSKQQLT
jgi:hypothetical protein